MNTHQVSKISLSPDVVDGIVFWTKNPSPMMERLNEMSSYTYYFQFTINPYGKDIEPNIPSKNDFVIPVFQRLSDKIGAKKMIWRYDPIVLNDKYTISYHFDYFDKISRRLKDHLRKCTFSFLDMYKNTESNVRCLDLHAISEEEMRILAYGFAQIAKGYGIELDTCSEVIDLSDMGIGHAHCIDKEIFEQICGYTLKLGKDKNQRNECSCDASIDIGAYNTCINGCRYCYANSNSMIAANNHLKHNPSSSLLFGDLSSSDIVTERKVYSCRDFQQQFEL